MTRTSSFTLALLLSLFGCGGDDDGGSSGDGDGAGADADVDPGAPDVAFRLTDLDLRDPHAYAFLGACNDVTEVENDDFQTQIEEDNEGPDNSDTPDGLLDLSGLAVFRPLDQSAHDVIVDVVLGADCTAPLASTSCTKGDASSIMATGANDTAAACDVVLPDTTNGDYDPALEPAPAPCFAAAAPEGILEFGPFQLSEVAGAATYDGDPATGLIHGVLRGFLNEEYADATTITLPLLGDKPLSSLLPGGTDCCADQDDRDSDSDGASGWYVYLTFTAAEVTYSE